MLFVIWAIVGHGQERANVWYFGSYAGIDFSNDDPHILSDGSMIAEAGCSSICDSIGNLLFYTNGKKVWNKNHQQMPSGDSLNGSQILNQNSIILPLPESDSIYLLFTISDIDTVRGFNYSIVDMSLDGGLGDLVEKNISISNNVLEKITAIEHCNGVDYWIIVHGHQNDFYSHLVTENGLSDMIVESRIGTKPKADIGYMKTSPDSDKIVLPINDENLLAEIFSFDNKTGEIGNPFKVFSKIDLTYCYGIAFSPNGKVLYLSTRGMDYQIWQYNLEETNENQLNDEAVSIASGNNFAMQLAPNRKIYIASENRPYLNSINNPNTLGDGCDYESMAITFTQSNSLMGLPNFMQSWLYQPSIKVQNTCFLDSTLFSFNETQNIDSCRWNVYELSTDKLWTSNKFTDYNIFEDVGLYNVELNIYHCGSVDRVEEVMEIFSYPISILPLDTSMCNGCNLILDAGNGHDSYLWSDGSTQQFLSIYKTGLYSVEIGKNGCLTFDTVVVNEIQPSIYLPNAFTPNGDGINDVFKVVNPANVVNYNIHIVNRRGTIVYQSNDIYDGWDGKFSGQLCPRDTFFWLISLSYYNEMGNLVSESKRGMVTLIR